MSRKEPYCDSSKSNPEQIDVTLRRDGLLFRSKALSEAALSPKRLFEDAVASACQVIAVLVPYEDEKGRSDKYYEGVK